MAYLGFSIRCTRHLTSKIILVPPDELVNQFQFPAPNIQTSSPLTPDLGCQGHPAAESPESCVGATEQHCQGAQNFIPEKKEQGCLEIGKCVRRQK